MSDPVVVTNPYVEPTPTVGAEFGFDNLTTGGGVLDGLVGFDWARYKLLWSDIETSISSGTSNGSYTWTQVDSFVLNAVQNGYSLVFVLKVGHPYGIVDDECYAAATTNTGNEFNDRVSCPIKPSFYPAWKNFVRAIIRRYGKGPGGDAMPGMDSTFRLSLEPENEPGDANYFGPHIVADGAQAARDYAEILRLCYEAKQEEDWTGEIVLAGITLLERSMRCTVSPSSAGCGSPFDTRNRTFTEEILKYHQYFDAIDIHPFNYFYYLPEDIPNMMTYLRSHMDRRGFSKPIYAHESTAAILIWLKNRGGQYVFAPHFPYVADFQNLAYLDDNVNVSGGENVGPFDVYFFGTYTGSTQKTFAVAATENSLSTSPDFFYYTDDYQHDGANGGLTTWTGPVAMQIDQPQLLGDGVYAIWGSVNNHTGPFAVGALAHPASEPGSIDYDIIKYYYGNLDFIELPPPFGISADPKYRKWMEKEEADGYPKLICTLLIEGVTRFIYTQFHHYFPGFGWSSPWWRWNGVIRYTGGTASSPTFVRTPYYYSRNQFHSAIDGYSGVNIYNLADGVTCYQFNFTGSDPKYIFWVKPIGTKAFSYTASDSVDSSTPVAVAINTAFGWGSATVDSVVTELDGSNNPIYVTTTVVGAATIDATDTPKIAVRLS